MKLVLGLFTKQTELKRAFIEPSFEQLVNGLAHLQPYLYLSDLYWYCSSTGTCRYYDGGGCEIRLSEALRKVRPATDLKNVLLHEMIHAFLWIKCGNKEHSDHGSYFREKMKEINSSSVEDHQRPRGGYSITIHHEFKKEVKTYKYYHWICDTCGHVIEKIREPSASDCNQKVGPDGSCSNSKCDWHNHKNGCPGSYTREPESPRYNDQNLDSRGGQEIQERKTETLAHSTKRSIRRLHETEGSSGMSDGRAMIRIEHCLPTSSIVKRNSDDNSSFGDDNQRVLNPKQMNSVHAMAPQDRNGVKAVARKSKGGCSGRKRTREGECKKGRIAVSKWRECMKAYKNLGEWFVVYGEEEERGDVEPLRNKRSERRKRLKLLQSSKGSSSTSEAMTDDADLREEHESPEPTRNVQRTESIQTHAENDFEVAQGDECSAPSKLDAIQVSPSTVIDLDLDLDLNLPPGEAIPAEEARDPQPRHC